jgi:hypothetical protein
LEKAFHAHSSIREKTRTGRRATPTR